MLGPFEYRIYIAKMNGPDDEVVDVDGQDATEVCTLRIDGTPCTLWTH